MLIPKGTNGPCVRTILSTVFSAPVGFVFGDAPDCVYPSISTGLVIVGRDVARAMVQAPPPPQPAPETLNAMVSSPAAALACVTASRREPAPESLVLVTVKVAAESVEA